MTCDDVRLLIHETHDGERSAPLPAVVREHLAGCAACRELEADLPELTAALRALPRSSFPPEALDAVWLETVRAPRGAVGAPRLWLVAAAAVFVTLLSTSTLYLMFAPAAPQRPSADELARASAQAELVLGYTARALAATRTATADRVLASRVSPAVRGVPVSHPSRRPQ